MMGTSNTHMVVDARKMESRSRIISLSLIRHAEALHNQGCRTRGPAVSRESVLQDVAYFDAPLTLAGENATRAASAKIRQVVQQPVESHQKGAQINCAQHDASLAIDYLDSASEPDEVLVICSPLLRSLQTAAQIFPVLHTLHILDLVREAAGLHPCDERPMAPDVLSAAKDLFKSLQVDPDTTARLKSVQLTTHHYIQKGFIGMTLFGIDDILCAAAPRETRREVEARILQFLQWLIDEANYRIPKIQQAERAEQSQSTQQQNPGVLRMAVVTHSAFLRHLFALLRLLDPLQRALPNLHVVRLNIDADLLEDFVIAHAIPHNANDKIAVQFARGQSGGRGGRLCFVPQVCPSPYCCFRNYGGVGDAQLGGIIDSSKNEGNPTFSCCRPQAATMRTLPLVWRSLSSGCTISLRRHAELAALDLNVWLPACETGLLACNGDNDFGALQWEENCIPSSTRNEIEAVSFSVIPEIFGPRRDASQRFVERIQQIIENTHHCNRGRLGLIQSCFQRVLLFSNSSLIPTALFSSSFNCIQRNVVQNNSAGRCDEQDDFGLELARKEAVHCQTCCIFVPASLIPPPGDSCSGRPSSSDAGRLLARTASSGGLPFAVTSSSDPLLLRSENGQGTCVRNLPGNPVPAASGSGVPLLSATQRIFYSAEASSVHFISVPGF